MKARDRGRSPKVTIKTTTNRTIRLTIGTAAVLALMSQAAQAQPITWRGGMAHTAPTITLVRKGTYMPILPASFDAKVARALGGTALTIPPARGQVTQLTPPTQTVTGKTRVHWSAAAIGAGFAFALVLVVIGAATLIQHGRRRDPLSA
jgi:hypothetical protein